VINAICDAANTCSGSRRFVVLIFLTGPNNYDNATFKVCVPCTTSLTSSVDNYSLSS